MYVSILFLASVGNLSALINSGKYNNSKFSYDSTIKKNARNALFFYCASFQKPNFEKRTTTRIIKRRDFIMRIRYNALSDTTFSKRVSPPKVRFSRINLYRKSLKKLRITETNSKKKVRILFVIVNYLLHSNNNTIYYLVKAFSLEIPSEFERKTDSAMNRV